MQLLCSDNGSIENVANMTLSCSVLHLLPWRGVWNSTDVSILLKVMFGESRFHIWSSESVCPGRLSLSLTLSFFPPPWVCDGGGDNFLPVRDESARVDRWRISPVLWELWTSAKRGRAGLIVLTWLERKWGRKGDRKEEGEGSEKSHPQTEKQNNERETELEGRAKSRISSPWTKKKMSYCSSQLNTTRILFSVCRSTTALNVSVTMGGKEGQLCWHSGSSRWKINYVCMRTWEKSREKKESENVSEGGNRSRQVMRGRRFSPKISWAVGMR